MNNTALGFKAGFTGQFIEDELHKEGIQTQFVNVRRNHSNQCIYSSSINE